MTIKEIKFQIDFTDIVTLAYEKEDFRDMSPEEIKERVLETVALKIATLGTDEWVRSFYSEYKEIK